GNMGTSPGGPVGQEGPGGGGSGESIRRQRFSRSATGGAMTTRNRRGSGREFSGNGNPGGGSSPGTDGSSPTFPGVVGNPPSSSGYGDREVPTATDPGVELIREFRNSMGSSQPTGEPRPAMNPADGAGPGSSTGSSDVPASRRGRRR
ncbi:MAG: hypothetical protein Q4C47_06295, partial [Planctomycetia bacterium]|nr:hypothetical protein [Planctomycetia bacterium]